MLRFLGCCPLERPLGMGGSQSAGWSAEAADLSATRGKRNICAWWRAKRTLTRPYNGAPRTGAELEEFERASIQRRCCNAYGGAARGPRACGIPDGSAKKRI